MFNLVKLYKENKQLKNQNRELLKLASKQENACRECMEKNRPQMSEEEYKAFFARWNKCLDAGKVYCDARSELTEGIWYALYIEEMYRILDNRDHFRLEQMEHEFNIA